MVQWTPRQPQRGPWRWEHREDRKTSRESRKAVVGAGCGFGTSILKERFWSNASSIDEKSGEAIVKNLNDEMLFLLTW